MAGDLNRSEFIGRLGKDPEVRHLPNGDTVCSFSIAVGERWKDKDTGEKQERTEWVRCVAWRQLGEICGQYLEKGQQVYISGKFTTRKWTDKDGSDRYSTEIVVDQMQMLGGRKEQGNESAPSRPRSEAPSKPRSTSPSAGRRDGGVGDMDDDIPFDNPYRGRLCYVV